MVVSYTVGIVCCFVLHAMYLPVFTGILRLCTLYLYFSLCSRAIPLVYSAIQLSELQICRNKVDLNLSQVELSENVRILLFLKCVAAQSVVKCACKESTNKAPAVVYV